LQGLIQLLNLWIWTCDILFVYNFPTLGCKKYWPGTNLSNIPGSWISNCHGPELGYGRSTLHLISEILNKPKNLGNLGRSVIWKDSCSSCW
jgi:hypothetical protein